MYRITNEQKLRKTLATKQDVLSWINHQIRLRQNRHYDLINRDDHNVDMVVDGIATGEEIGQLRALKSILSRIVEWE